MRGAQPCAEQRKRGVSLTVSEMLVPAGPWALPEAGFQIPVEFETAYRQGLWESRAVASKDK